MYDCTDPEFYHKLMAALWSFPCDQVRVYGHGKTKITRMETGADPYEGRGGGGYISYPNLSPVGEEYPSLNPTPRPSL